MKKILFLGVLMVLSFGFAGTVYAENDTHVVDHAHLLTSQEKQELEQELDEISERQRFDIVVVTVNSTDGKTAEAYADDYFDQNGYGYGTTADGALLLVDMGQRNWHITTTGYGITALTDAGLVFIRDRFKGYLSAGKYMEAFRTYGRWVDRFVTEARSGKPYDKGHLPVTLQFWVIGAIGSVLLAAFIAYSWLQFKKRQLRTVFQKTGASDYLVPHSFSLEDKQRLFLYRTLHQTRIERSSDSGGSGGGGGGGSTTHTSSSGTSHGGLGGSF
ncbi:TPM domain-containing protein [Streptococcus sp. DD13]|uniref:TPM domain-containing protein n=1 Tax=Streptococcus sp. DD13 TaxID=1777881 RepID=UPI00079A3949|nr:TPM domain-containing protein [Streptococcus sp. DD13]KXT77580.1 hypothetical protein STRDD13_01451 [Streptococcus sp. DD13]